MVFKVVLELFQEVAQFPWVSLCPLLQGILSEELKKGREKNIFSNLHSETEVFYYGSGIGW